MEDSKAEIKADLEVKLEGRGKGVVVGQWKEVLRSMAATVIRADPSCVVVKMENGEVHFECTHDNLPTFLFTFCSIRWACKYWRSIL